MEKLVSLANGVEKTGYSLAKKKKKEKNEIGPF